ncbi:hypothetical protein [Nocardioides sp. TF02-7]|uniref:hypothetical protein n=1 Tax=Nocardioides sp. TF02-7 TaxID=2917724 RepID=UPI001F061DBF|nr:hypothetical protein [Nocardioides sp. TF02-7]UMG95015.1 hypothetical protein MF408_11640 [Nocardioides sp. TF02-7]
MTAGPSPAVRCARSTVRWPRVLELVRFARGLGPTPDFSDEVAIAVGTGRHVTLTAEEAADPDSWVLCADGECHSALAALAEMVTDRAGTDDIPVSLGLQATHDLGPGMTWDCVTPDPYELALKVHLATYVFMDDPTTDRPCPRPPVVQVEWSEDRRIAGVRLRLPVEMGATTRPTPRRAATADAFVRWARGDRPPPAFADQVRLMFDGEQAFGNEAWLEPPYARSGFVGCSGLGFPDCGLDPFASVLRHDGPVGTTAGRAGCPAGGDVPPSFAESGDDVVTLASADAPSCDGWAVELWIGDDGAIYGLNQIGGVT